jgi:WhiB family redox-sensing transcriptional regulator
MEILASSARPSWMDEAACKGRTTLFFGIAGERPERRVRREAAARKVCAGCPVLEPCRTLARLNRENGLWGGETEEERAAAGFAPRSISRRAVQEAAAQAS